MSDDEREDAPAPVEDPPDLRLADPTAPGVIIAKNGEVMPPYKHPGGPFQPGNAWAFGPNRKSIGRPKGLRDRLQSDFVEALTRDFEEHGPAAIAAMRLKKPADYCKVIASILPRQLEVKEQPFGDITDTELASIIAAARGSLVAAEGRGRRVQEADGDEPAPGLPALPETEAVPR